MLLLAIVVSGAASCTENIEGGAACPSLCPNRLNDFRDTIVDVVVLDTSVGAFPSSGLNGLLLLANRGDTVQTSAIIRYDVLPTTFVPNNTSGADAVPITDLDSVWIRLTLDSTARSGTQPVLLEAFDVDTTHSDSVTSVVQSLFRQDRLLGSVTITPSTLGDSLRVPLDKDRILDKVRNGARLRVGLRFASHGQIRIVSFGLGAGNAILSFDAKGDTIYSPIRTLPNTLLNGGTVEQALAYSIYPIVDRATAQDGNGVLQVGGFPATRSYLQFDLPQRFLDSTTIVRAELLLTQVPAPFARSTDSVFIEPLIPSSSNVVTDIRRLLDLAAAASFYGLDSTRFLAADSGEKSINVIGIIRSWRFLSKTVPRAVGLRLVGEGQQATDVRFLSMEGATTPQQRPRLRITYLPRAEFALP